MGDKAKGIGGSILRYILAIVLLILLGGGFSFLSNYVSSHNKQFSQAEYTDLNPLVEADQELPADEWGRISIRWVVDYFATEENSYTTYGVQFDSGTSYYFLAVLDNFQAIAVQASDEAEIARLNKMSDDFWENEDIYALPTQDFEGKVQKMTNKELIGYYDDALSQMGFKDADSLINIQYLILNTSAIPTRNVLLYVGIGALAVIAVVVFVRMRKKSRQEAAQAEEGPTPAQTNDQENTQ